MRTKNRFLVFGLTIILSALIIVSAQPAKNLMNQSTVEDDRDYKKGEIGNDKTLSPYFFVKSESAETDCLPLLETTADVVISGVIADVTVRQVYKNSGKHTLEAVYVFPASTRAAVYAMTMTIGERVLEAVIKPKQTAREMYEKAKTEGRTASLLEQQRPNVFQMNVANIIPGDLIVVEMKYTELLVPEDKIYEFVYPTVVGPRYSNKKESETSEDDKFVNTPYLHQGSEMPFKFDINVRIAAGMNIDLIECPSHSAFIDKGEPNEATIKLSDEGKKTWNKDYILRYTLAGENIETGMLISTGDENFFLLMLQPPKRLEPKNIPPREYIYIVDVSGSMQGFPLDVAKKLMNNLLKNLNPEDKFNVLLFSMGQGLLAEKSLPATNENIKKAANMLQEQTGGDGTELLPALERALALPKAEGYSRSIVVITDGYVDCEREAFELIRKNLNNSNLFSFRIGDGVNRYIIDGMAHAGGGEPFVVTAPDEAEYMSAKLNEYINSPVMTGIEIDYGRFKAYDVEPVSIPDVLADRPILIYGKWEGAVDGVIKVSGYYGDKKIHVDIPVSQFANHTNNPAIKYLWARNKIAILSDYANLGTFTKAEEEEVTQLGMKYNLLTKYTSFIAEDYLVRNEGGKLVKVKQASPLPEGVTDNAVGGNAAVMYMDISSRAYVEGGSGSQLSMEMSESEDISSSADFTISNSEIRVNGLDKGSNNEPAPDEFVPVEREPVVNLKKIQKNLVYPELARKAGVEGKVLVRVLIAKNGKIKKMIIEYSDSEMLNEAAKKAIQKCKYFVPAIQNGSPIDCWVSIPVEFKIKKKEKK